ncbi:anthranilate phosphoribosyltransferase [Grosmannia clavigera kw1407]|uniref:Anthranilate phosphoribosyltransferase n=1 Tax=Grosmannia clavigera (strain kw1407 / UAMH 11150) TaxID=655863 RepID=F0XP93_GROCL|nr:anthranilate phosphoribosyltransferase [Grosmannia clavigera kw1407]EFX00185.1 anthranilate phosphoribosyltransferase [Grosmannia clavigera kw1407]
MATQTDAAATQPLETVDIKPLLSRLWPLSEDDREPLAGPIADAIALFFTNQVSEAQSGALLMCLHFTGLDRQADVMAACAARMRRAAAPVAAAPLRAIMAQQQPNLQVGNYGGGLCDIVGTGGDSHNTFNVSTASSIVASAWLRIAKHGNRASTSKSGSADLLANLHYCPQRLATIENETTDLVDLVADLSFVRPSTLPQIYAATNYAFLFAPVFHPGMRFVAPIRRQLPWRTLFNLLGPLANPVDVDDGIGPSPLEARVIGVARRELGPVFADALRMAGARKALIVCGAEDLDEISIAGPTYCWALRDNSITPFCLEPADFGVAAHPLSVVSPGREPAENAATMLSILNNERSPDDPLLSFVLINTAALLVTSGLCDDDNDSDRIPDRGPGGGRWKDGVRRARLALATGETQKQWQRFVEVTNQIVPASQEGLP